MLSPATELATASESIETVFERDGFAVCRGMLPEPLVAAARGEYGRRFAEAPMEMPDDLDQVLLVMWYHAVGGRKRYLPLAEAPAFEALATAPPVVAEAKRLCGGPVRLFEVIVFNKPPGIGGQLSWHQDNSFYPLAGGRQVSALIALDRMDAGNGGVSFAVGSHRSPLMGSPDLQSGAPLAGEALPVPQNPTEHGYTVVTPDLLPGEVVLFDGLVWHGSGPNDSADRERRLLSIRFASLDTVYSPRPGNSATFVRQIRSAPGERLDGAAFPILG